MTIYTFSVAGTGTDRNGTPVAVSFTLQRQVTDPSKRMEHDTSASDILRAAAEKHGIDDLRITESHMSQNAITTGGIPAKLQLIER